MAMAMAMVRNPGVRPEQLFAAQRKIGFAILAVAFAASPKWLLAQEAAPAAIPAQESGLSAQGGSDAGAPRRAWAVLPRIGVTETFSDNAALNRNTQSKSGEQITQISPGIRLEGQSARLKVYFDYTLNQIYYSQDSNRNTTQNALSSFGTFEALEKWLYLDFSGTISQQNISAFGTQSSSNSSINSNSTETSTFRLSPYLKGRLLGFADYQLRYDRTTTKARSSLASDSDTESWSANLNGVTALSSLAWSMTATRQIADYSRGRNTEADRMTGMLIWQIDPQIKLRVSGGEESNNYVSLDKESHSTYGYGVDWSPTERTSLSAFRESRFFGNGHNITFTHRTPMTAWRFSDSRDVSLMNQAGNVGLGTIYDLVFSMFASLEPDPVKRAALVSSFFLLNPGISPTAVVSSNFLTSQATLQRRRELSFAINGVANTVVFTASQNHQEALSSQSLAFFGDSFATSTVVSQRSFGVNWSHRLTPISSLSAALFRSNTSGSSGVAANPHVTQNSLTVNYSTRLGAKTAASLGLRRTVSESDISPYTENALTGTLTHQF